MKVLISILAALMFSVGLAACGGDDDATPNVTNSPAQTATNNNGGDDDPTATEDSGGDDEPTASEDTGGGDIEPVDTLDFEEQGDLINACELITKEEVETVMGGVSEEPNPSYLEPFSDCAWEEVEFGYSFNLSVYQGSREGAEVLFGLGADDNEEVDGIGERAQWDPTIGYLEALEGDYELSVTVFDFSSDDEAQRLEQAKTLIAKAIERLP